MNALHKLATLDAPRRAALFFCLGILVKVRVGLLLRPYRSVKDQFERHLSRQPGPAPDPAVLAWATRAAARIVPGASCLPQAMCLQIAMAAHGLPSTVRIGVRRDERGQFKAHAWLVSEGRTLIGGAALRAETFTPITDLDFRV